MSVPMPTAARPSAAAAVAVAAIIGEGADEGRARPAGSRSAERTARAILGHVHAQRTALEVLAVELADGLLRLLLVRELDEREAARPAGGAIDRNGDVDDVAGCSEDALQLMLGRVVGKVPHEDSAGDDDAPYGRWLQSVREQDPLPRGARR